MLTAIGYVNPNDPLEEGGDKPKLHLKANFFASGPAWDRLMRHPGLPRMLMLHTEYVARQSMFETERSEDEAQTPLDDLPDVRSAPEGLTEAWIGIVTSMLDGATREERESIAYYFTVGSVNLDYRSMVLNAETMVIATRWQALAGFADFLLLPGLCEWVDTQEQLDVLLPPPSGLRRTISNFIRILL
jgi:hypothetical protein